ncbi:MULTISPECIES: flagellar biosynthetic protein FliR [unclassified Gilliamella]|uniref:flagellar biosynthetic protein FliR n=1 Tax=unclassified Gilliamella TaxID=2685620 RepID=UPI00080DFEF7|nr:MULTISPECIES: flagellar biosynthetic protein FliR [Gilliamella]MCX8583689.1 flagellar biosynthetic protein FliR [Gilliamella sp. B3372]MCX8595102.1 flagellar biosynthetic protein FliR [Gilliamella sp. B3367]MCX8661116.1 flagellar biosynthetic protein FliR [Gilliamella sp. B2772]MCX8662252.1 flagellar biosynthetic protein FliR [Gilliamella sp. B2911]OCG00529.1 flagellar biosynthetic protein FliR [Gilliamella apicola]
MDLAIVDLLNIDFFAWVQSSFLPFVRILALIMVAPITGEKEVPNRVKIGLAILIVIVLPLPKLDDNLTLYSLMGIWIIAQQIMIGILIGFAIQLTFMTVRFSGELISMQMGLGMATFYDPISGPSTSVLSRLINIIAMLIFLSLDGHLWLLYGLANSFDIIPITVYPLKQNGYLALIEITGLLFNNGIMLALPLMTLLLIINLSLGLLNRFTPQLSIFVVGYPLTLLCGLTMLSYLFSALPLFVESILEQIFSTISRILIYLADVST